MATATGWTVKGSTVKATWLTGYQWAKYDASGVRVETPDGAFGTERQVPTAEMLAAWDAEAPAKCAELLGAVTDAPVASQSIRARYDGQCAVTGRDFFAGARIQSTPYGWALADEQTARTMRGGDAAMVAANPDFLTRQMARDDSRF